MSNNESDKSLRGNLITTIIEKWILDSLFEQNQSTVIEFLEHLFYSNLKFDTEISWNFDENKGVSGNVEFIDEKEKIKIINFNVLGVNLSTKEKENEEEN